MRQFFLPLLLATACLAPAAEKIVGGPFVVNVGSKNATVVWIVQSAEVTIGERSAPVLRSEKALFSGLQAGTLQNYKVPGVEGLTGSFKTSPAGDKPFEFVVFGDTRTRHDVHRRVVDSILKNASPEFVIHSGDLVTDGTDSAQWPIFFDIERELLRKTAYFPALGNHERNSRQFYEFFNVSTPYYSFNWGNCHFVVLNSDIANVSASSSARAAYWAEQLRWLEEDLGKNQKAEFRIVAAHHPPITAVSKRQGEDKDVMALMPIFEKYKVEAGYFGHDHNYQHFLKNGVHYVISGGGGAPLYPVDAPPAGITQKVISAEHFVRIQVNGKSYVSTAIGADGKELDRFELKH